MRSSRRDIYLTRTSLLIRHLRVATQVLELCIDFQGFVSNIHTWHWGRVREPHLRWLVNEYHVAGLVPCVRVVDDMSS